MHLHAPAFHDALLTVLHNITSQLATRAGSRLT